jgi:hypothetical protein
MSEQNELAVGVAESEKPEEVEEEPEVMEVSYQSS